MILMVSQTVEVWDPIVKSVINDINLTCSLITILMILYCVYFMNNFINVFLIKNDWFDINDKCFHIKIWKKLK